jgi:signal transduction histidine kinase
MRSSLDRLRRHVRELYPVSLADDGLMPGLRELASNAEALYGVSCQVTGDEVDVNSADVATQLYRIMQEAITNSVKHGEATRIDVKVTRDDDHLTMTIENNGTHINPDAVQKTNGMGVRIMRQRARAIQAGFEISPTERGTMVRVSLKHKQLIRPAGASSASTSKASQSDDATPPAASSGATNNGADPASPDA